MPTRRTTDPLLPGKVYHIYNRGNEKTRIFYTEANYRHFVKLYKEYLEEFVNTYAYCFIPNHFHLLISIKETNDSSPYINVSQQFRKLFISYAMAINKQQKRRGSLFQRPFRRQIITTNWQLKRVVYYIHYNPVKHHLTNNLKSFKYSSYQDITNHKKGLIDSDTVISWFNDMEEFIEYHDFLSNPKG